MSCMISYLNLPFWGKQRFQPTCRILTQKMPFSANSIIFLPFLFRQNPIFYIMIIIKNRLDLLIQRHSCWYYCAQMAPVKGTRLFFTVDLFGWLPTPNCWRWWPCHPQMSITCRLRHPDSSWLATDSPYWCSCPSSCLRRTSVRANPSPMA